MDFTAITTQEQFDAAIGERLKREKEKYADYEQIKAKNEEYAKQIEALGKAMDEEKGKYAGYDQNLAELNSKIQNYEKSSVKMRIAHETGIPFELAARLSGETEDEMRKDAETMSRFIAKSAPVAPLRTVEDKPVNTKEAALKALNEQLTKGD